MALPSFKVLTLTDAAAARVKEIIARAERPIAGVRVGVKNGVNLRGVKNFVGTFAPPFAVLNDLRFVLTLPERDKIAGMAEAVKVSLIRDAEFFRWIERHMDDLATFDPAAMAYMIRRYAELQMRQIGQSGDPFESSEIVQSDSADSPNSNTTPAWTFVSHSSGEPKSFERARATTSSPATDRFRTTI